MRVGLAMGNNLAHCRIETDPGRDGEIRLGSVVAEASPPAETSNGLVVSPGNSFPLVKRRFPALDCFVHTPIFYHLPNHNSTVYLMHQMKLGQLLSTYMSAHALSTRDLAREIGCDHSTIHRIIRGEPCRMDILLQILVWILNPTKNNTAAKV